MSDLIQFLWDRLDDDEAVAEAATKAPWRLTPPPLSPDYDPYAPEPYIVAEGFGAVAAIENDWTQDGRSPDGEHIARHDPARVLAEVQAKRHIIDRHVDKDGYCDECGSGTEDSGPGWPGDFHPVPWPCPTLRLLALPYDTHEAYDESWRP